MPTCGTCRHCEPCPGEPDTRICALISGNDRSGRGPLPCIYSDDRTVVFVVPVDFGCSLHVAALDEARG